MKLVGRAASKRTVARSFARLVSSANERASSSSYSKRTVEQNTAEQSAQNETPVPLHIAIVAAGAGQCVGWMSWLGLLL